VPGGSVPGIPGPARELPEVATRVLEAKDLKSLQFFELQKAVLGYSEGGPTSSQVLDPKKVALVGLLCKPCLAGLEPGRACPNVRPRLVGCQLAGLGNRLWKMSIQ
jgi:hypothetical protein